MKQPRTHPSKIAFVFLCDTKALSPIGGACAVVLRWGNMILLRTCHLSMESECVWVCVLLIFPSGDKSLCRTFSSSSSSSSSSSKCMEYAAGLCIIHLYGTGSRPLRGVLPCQVQASSTWGHRAGARGLLQQHSTAVTHSYSHRPIIHNPRHDITPNDSL